MKRQALPIALLVLSLVGCKEPARAQDPTSGFIRPGTDVVIKSVRTTSTADSQAFSTDEYYIVTFTFTNDLGYALVPRIDHFVIEDKDRRRFLGADSGSPALVGIDNASVLLKPGESHVYTVGFRVPINTTGALYYDATF